MKFREEFCAGCPALDDINYPCAVELLFSGESSEIPPNCQRMLEYLVLSEENQHETPHENMQGL